MDFLKPGDSVMADHGFDIEEDMYIVLCEALFLRGKGQLSEKELITTGHIASLQIHVE